MRKTSRMAQSGVFALMLCTASCAVHHVVRDVSSPGFLPERFSKSGGEVKPPDHWWESFNSAKLNELMDLVLSNNLDLQTAWARVDQAEALARVAGSPRWPTLNMETTASRGRSHLGPLTITEDQYSNHFSAAYEVDLWQRIASAKSGADLDVLATREDLEAIAITLTSQVAQTWFSIIEERAQRHLLSEQLKVSQTFLDLVQLRFGQGRASAVDVYQQREQLASVQAQVPMVESRLGVLANELAVLIGQAPPADITSSTNTLPQAPPLPAIGIPMDLLQQRPDIRSARIRVAAADYRVAAAIADRMPALRLGGQSAYQGPQVRDLFSNWIWNLSASFFTPLVDGGRRRAEVDRSKAMVTQRLREYEKAVLNALKEVENALTQEENQKDYVDKIQGQLGMAKKTLTESQARYVHGLSDYLPVLTALQSVQRLERTLLAARLDLILFRIDLYRALGGSWTKELAVSDKKGTVVGAAPSYGASNLQGN